MVKTIVKTSAKLGKSAIKTTSIYNSIKASIASTYDEVKSFIEKYS